MGGIGDAVARGLQNIASAVGDIGGSFVRFLGDAFGSADATIHQFVPWFIPGWLLAAAVIFIIGLFVFRR